MTVARFRLLRYFSATSLIGVLVVLAALLFFYRQFAFRALEQHQTRENVSITQVFASTLWSKYAAFVTNASKIPGEELPQHPEIARIRADVLRLMKGLAVVKVKIYNLDGLTVFSTDPKQIGEDKSRNAGFLAAKDGVTTSDITFRNRFDAIEEVINDRNLIATYTAIRTDPRMPVEGVVEVYSDVTDYVRELEKTTWEIVAVVLGSLSLLYLFLFAIVRRADGLIRTQSEEVRVANKAILDHQARHDALTGLPNRVHFSEGLETMIFAARRAGQKCAVLYLDLDGFKDINDSLGHVAGDRVLKEVSKRLRECLRDADITARIGGDEFVIALSEISGKWGIDRLVTAADRVRRAVSSEAIAVDGNDLKVTTSIGVAIYPDDGKDVVELIKSTDVALNHAKKTGRDNCQFNTADMNARVTQLLKVERELRRGLDEKQFLLHFQPQVDLATGRIIGAEALIRWQHPEHGLVYPGNFIPVAEEKGLIVPIGEWVLRESCRQNRQWQEAGLPAVPIAVNLSASQFQQKDLSREVLRAVQECHLAPECLELELTESSVMRDANATIATMNLLKAVGVKLSLDDFGTGFSSLSQLKRLPLDKLKVDKSFVSGLPDDANDLAICTAVIAMGRALGLKVIAEGVETRAQLETLRLLGCDEIQGFFIAKPMPAPAYLLFARKDRAI